MAGPYRYPDAYPNQPFTPEGGYSRPYPENAGSAYPGMLPPPVQYPRRRWPQVAAAVALAVVLVAGVVAAIVFASRDGETAGPGLTESAAHTAIQDYLNALADGDDETVARNALCGLYDDVNELRSDLEVADLNSDAFRKQFGSAEITAINKIVYWSANQAQVLFTMRVALGGGSSRGQSGDKEVQAVAQLLRQNDEILVCNYLVRTGRQY